ncbi:cytochrome c [Roseimicrobium gellanilyticum]|uniref:Cytochrome c n=1 Tax=Roseimicrobium gellanilyticum TaxID=748857 RepID=A0A366HIH0_9BACT|nr:PSD1 and planctomycete cytochrome C domain-containing protein [Roseimicrobium gellanilyticum]RBP42558.1 cytochrome c [Roseimicrobium gellanilyticum]
MRRTIHHWLLWSVSAGVGACLAPLAAAADEQASGDAFFEKEVRPVLERRCFECHSHTGGKAKGGLVLDSRSGWQTGGEGGPALVPGSLEKSMLIRAVRHVDDALKMPPREKLPAADIAVLEKWVSMGAPDPRVSSVVSTHAKKGIDVEAGRKHWAYQPMQTPAVPAMANASAASNSIDAFIHARLQKEGLGASSRADARVLIRRLYFDLLGVPPSFEEVETFAANQDPQSYTRLVDELLARPEYGQRWGRHWLDVTRYADTIEQSVDGERRIPFAHTYRDYVVDALNADVPFDRMILEQLAADRIPNGDLRALGFLTVGRQFRSNADGPMLVIDDRIDVVGRGFMGMTLACARCHDHKFDPVPTADYYSLAGILGSVEQPIDLPQVGHGNVSDEAMKPYLEKRQQLLRDWEAHVDQCFANSKAHFRTMATEYLRYIVRSSSNHRTTEGYIPLDTPSGLLFYQAPPRWEALLEKSKASGEPFFKLWHQCMTLPREGFAEKVQSLFENMRSTPAAYHPWIVRYFSGATPTDMLAVADVYGQLIQEALKSETAEAKIIVDLVYGPDSPVPPANREEIAEDIPRFLTEKRLVHRREAEAGTAILTKLSALEATAPVERAMSVRASVKPMDPRVLVRGDMKRPGTPVPRRFLSVLSEVDSRSYADDGRLQLAEAIANPRNPLTARVIVNRVWQHHFGNGLVASTDDFGVMGEKPVHPELLDHLASWFITHGWSMKALHRYILTSATWQQSSIANTDGLAKDPSNRLLWRVSPRRLEFEPMRDALLQASGQLDTRHGGRSQALNNGNLRRALYGYTDRFRIPALLRNFDVANPDTSISRRSETLVPLQALYMMNNPFVRERTVALVKRKDVLAAATDTDRIRTVFKIILSRNPDNVELEASMQFLNGARLSEPAGRRKWESFAQGLLLSNEFVFVD